MRKSRITVRCNLENLLNQKLVHRAKLNEDIVDLLRDIQKNGFVLIPETRDFTGKYFRVVNKEEV